MQIYVLVFLNASTFHILGYMGLELLIEKLNVMCLMSTSYIFVFAIYDRHVLKNAFYIPAATLFILLGLITYNYFLAYKIFFALSIVLFVLFFVLDYVYNSINLKIEINEKVKSETEDTCSEVTYDYKQSLEDDLNNFINTQLESSLVLLGLSHDYTYAQLNKAYKKAADLDKKDNGMLIQELNEARMYLQDRLKRFS